MPAGVPSPEARKRVVNAVVLAAGFGLVLAGIGLAQPAIALALTVVGLVLAIPAMRRLLPEGTLRAAPGMPATIATMGLLNLAFFGVDAFVPLALVDVRGTSVAYAGLHSPRPPSPGRPGLGPGPHRDSRPAAGDGLARSGLPGASFVITAAVLFPQTPLPAALFGWGVAGLGMGLAYTTLGLSMLELVEPGQEGDASASLQLASVLGSGLGAGIGGALIALMHARVKP